VRWASATLTTTDCAVRLPAPGHNHEHRLPSHGLALSFAGILVDDDDVPTKPGMGPLTARKVFDTFHSMHDQCTFTATGDALLQMDTTAPAGTTAKQIYTKAQCLHKKGLERKAGQARDSFLASARAKWIWPGNDNVTHNTTL
jgi:hypothetical protein